MYDGTRVVISNEAEGAWEQEFDSGSLSGMLQCSMPNETIMQSKVPF